LGILYLLTLSFLISFEYRRLSAFQHKTKS
jgi:hypothetical protein